MARSPLDTLVYSTILVAPLATALAYIAFTPAPAPVVLVATPDCPAAAEPIAVVIAAEEPAPVAIVDEPAPVVDEPAPPATVEPPTAGAGALMFDRRLVLATDPDPSWAHGALHNHANAYGMTVTKAVDPARLPGFLGALAGQRFTVFAADGSSCLVDAGPLSVYARVDGDVNIYIEPGDEGYDASGEPSPKQMAALRKQVFLDHAELLVARLEGSPRCTGLWARRADLPAPAVYGERSLADADANALAAEVAPVLADHPAVLAIRAKYRTWYDEIDAGYRATVSAWPAFYRESIVVRRWDEVGGAGTYYTVDVGTGGEACSSEFADHTSFVLTRDAGGWQIVPGQGFWRPLALMDLDRDGHLEAVTRGGVALESSGPDRGFAQSFEIPWWGCPC